MTPEEQHPETLLMWSHMKNKGTTERKEFPPLWLFSFLSHQPLKPPVGHSLKVAQMSLWLTQYHIWPLPHVPGLITSS